MAKRDNTQYGTHKMSPYARTEVRRGAGNEYDWSTDDYEVGMCDACGLKDEYIGRTGRGWGQLEAWVEAHNQRYHQEETRPTLVSANPQLKISVALTCGHVWPESSGGERGIGAVRDRASLALGRTPGQCCAGKLTLYEGNWQWGRPLYVCPSGHLNEIAGAPDRRAAGRVLSQQIERVMDEQQQMLDEIELEERIEQLEQRKLDLERRRSKR